MEIAETCYFGRNFNLCDQSDIDAVLRRMLLVRDELSLNDQLQRHNKLASELKVK